MTAPICSTGKILSLYDRSGQWSAPYREAAYEVEQIDLHSGGDVRLFEKPASHVHGILAAPPCTVFAASGSRWKRSAQEMTDGLALVDAVLRLVTVTEPCWWALENPVGKLVRWLGKPTMYFHPYEYGDPYTKKTALWGSFTVPRQRPVKPEAKSRIHYMSKGPERAYLRSVTPAGFAHAFFEANP